MLPTDTGADPESETRIVIVPGQKSPAPLLARAILRAMFSPEFKAAIRQDPQTVTPTGQKVQPLIDGLIVRHCPPLEDHRGELIEVFNSEWAFDDAPLVYAYQVVLRPRSVQCKG